jgi:hypothetical protein
MYERLQAAAQHPGVRRPRRRRHGRGGDCRGRRGGGDRGRYGSRDPDYCDRRSRHNCGRQERQMGGSRRHPRVRGGCLRRVGLAAPPRVHPHLAVLPAPAEARIGTRVDLEVSATASSASLPTARPGPLRPPSARRARCCTASRRWRGERDGQDRRVGDDQQPADRSNGRRRHASNPTATGSPTATARAAVSRATVADDAAESATRTDTAPIAIAAPIPTMSSRLGAAHRRPILHRERGPGQRIACERADLHSEGTMIQRAM